MERIASAGFIPPWIRREHQARFEFCARYVADKIVIDCASGEGFGSRIFAANARRVVAIDLSIAALRQVPSNVGAVVADAASLPLRSASAEVFVGLETIEHVPDGAAFAREASRGVGSRGVFICSTPNRDVTNPASVKVINPFHVREYTLEEFTRELAPAFKNVEMFGQCAEAKSMRRVCLWIAEHISTRAAARLRQATKLIRLVADWRARYVVEKLRPGVDYEFFVAVCSN